MSEIEELAESANRICIGLGRDTDFSNPMVIGDIKAVKKGARMRARDSSLMSRMLYCSVFREALQKYYNNVLGTVCARASEQCFRMKEFSLENAIDGFSLDLNESAIIGTFAKKAYEGAKKEDEEHRKFIEEIRPYRKKTLLINLGTSAFAGILTYGATGSAWAGYLGGVTTSLILSWLEVRYHSLSALQAGTRPRARGDAFSPKQLAQDTLTQLLGLYG
jgi:hypothetical protein